MTPNERIARHALKLHLARRHLEWTAKAVTETEQAGLPLVADYFRDRMQEAESDLKDLRLPTND